jgi:hypothetical protein
MTSISRFGTSVVLGRSVSRWRAELFDPVQDVDDISITNTDYNRITAGLQQITADFNRQIPTSDNTLQTTRNEEISKTPSSMEYRV